jgi:hypothetical protein
MDGSRDDDGCVVARRRRRMLLLCIRDVDLGAARAKLVGDDGRDLPCLSVRGAVENEEMWLHTREPKQN